MSPWEPWWEDFLASPIRPNWSIPWKPQDRFGLFCSRPNGAFASWPNRGGRKSPWAESGGCCRTSPTLASRRQLPRESWFGSSRGTTRIVFLKHDPYDKSRRCKWLIRHQELIKESCYQCTGSFSKFVALTFYQSIFQNPHLRTHMINMSNDEMRWVWT